MATVVVVPDPKLIHFSDIHQRELVTSAGDSVLESLPRSPSELLRARRKVLTDIAFGFFTSSLYGLRALETRASLAEVVRPLEALGAFLVEEELIDRQALEANGLARVFDNEILPQPREKKVRLLKLKRSPEDKQWHLKKIHIGAARQAQLTGCGVLVGLLDTGIECTHNELKGRLLEFRQFDREGKPVRDDELNRFSVQHGTQVASLVAGKTLGVAPECKLAIAGVFDEHGRSPRRCQLLAGINWLLAQPFRENMPLGVDVLSCSVAFPGCDDVLYGCTREARSVTGKLLVAGIGNAGRVGKGSQEVPGSYDHVVGVGATDRKDKVADLSAWGPACSFSQKPAPTLKPDLCAPGEGVWTAHIGNARSRSFGTSFSTPQVAGAAALLIQRNPALSHDPDALQKALFRLVTPIKKPKKSGRGRLDLSNIALLLPAPSSEPSPQIDELVPAE